MLRIRYALTTPASVFTNGDYTIDIHDQIKLAANSADTHTGDVVLFNVTVKDT